MKIAGGAGFPFLIQRVDMEKPRIFITAANRGIGLGLTQQYLNSGCKVLATYRSQKKAENLKALKGDIQLFCLDIQDTNQIRQIKEKIKDEPIDILINNAAIHGPKDDSATFGQIDIDSWLEVMKTNVFYTTKLTELLFDLIKKSKQKKIVFISSRAGSISERGKLPHHLPGGTYIYRASKAALNAIAQSLAFDYTGQGISVIVLHPGFVKTDMAGAQADISVEESIKGMKKIIDNFEPSKNGKFYNYDGEVIGW